MRIYAFLTLSLTVPYWAFSQGIETARLKVTLKQGAALEVVDKKAAVTWYQSPRALAVDDVRTTPDELSFTLDHRLQVRIKASNEILDVTLSGDLQTSIEGLEYPAGFVLADAAHQSLVLPQGSGLVIPFSMKDAPYLRKIKDSPFDANFSETGLIMPWTGVTDGNAGSMTLVTTPFDATFKINTDEKGYQPTLRWLNSKGHLAYDRNVRFYFSDSGGYVALCKIYRTIAREQGLLVSLKEKAKKAPALERFVGAMSFWIVDWPDISFLTEMKAAGIERALISYHVDSRRIPATVQNRPGLYPVYEAMSREFAQQVQHLGYLANRMDYYRTIYPPSMQRGQWIMRRTGYPEQCALDPNGKPWPGFGARPGAKEIMCHRCSARQYQMAEVSIPADVDRVGYDARFVDTLASVPLHECYDPAHPVTRTEDMQYRFKLLALMRDYGLIAGTEYFGSWAVPAAHYGESPMTFLRFFTNTMTMRDQLTPVPIVVPPEYREVALNERIRVPLWQLVFHEAAIITGRWDWTANRFVDKQDWDKEMLIFLVHGTMPTMLTDRANFEANKDRFIKNYQMVCKWNELTGYEEMTDHRWLAGEGTVQQVTYESGRKVVVNFGTSGYGLSDGKVVPASGFLTIQ